MRIGERSYVRHMHHMHIKPGSDIGPDVLDNISSRLNDEFDSIRSAVMERKQRQRRASQLIYHLSEQDPSRVTLNSDG